MSEHIQGEPVGFTRPVPPDYLAHLELNDANELIDYVLHQSRPDPYPARARFMTCLSFGVGLVLAIVVLMLVHRTDGPVLILCAAVVGWLARYGTVELHGARHGRANEHVTAIIADYERRAIERGER